MYLLSVSLNQLKHLLAALLCRMELTPFNDFNTALDKALGKLGSQPKQVIRF